MSDQNDRANIETSPKLDRPGAGIPWIQKLALRVYVKPWVAQKAPWEKSRERFLRVTKKILDEIEGLSSESLEKKILVPKQTGLEDSSRYWSIAMTLEHLVIVGKSIAQVVESLTHNQTIDQVADTALVKPFGKQSAQESVQDFKNFCLVEFGNIKIGDKNSKNAFRHPWFGPMTAQAWYWLFATHHNIHLQQIRAIKSNLKIKS